MKTEPVRSQKEYEKGLSDLAIQTANKLKIPVSEARIRIESLFLSGILDGGHPDDPLSQIKIDLFLQIPSSNYEHFDE